MPANRRRSIARQPDTIDHTDMRTTILSRLVFLPVFLVLVVLLAACGNGLPTPTGTPVPTPTAQAVVELYEFFQAEKERNPVRFDRIMEDEDLFGFTGIVSRIDGSTIRFHIAERRLRRDLFVECEFRESQDMLSLSVGEKATLYGKIDKAKRVVRFEECRLAGSPMPER